VTTPNLFPPPPKYVLPLSLGGDLSVDFQNNPSGDGTTFVNYATGVTVTLILDITTPVQAPATISTYHAAVKIESAVTDTIPNATKWRLIVSSPTSPTTETVAAYGTVKRFDG
jgi:hypothetical protein